MHGARCAALLALSMFCSAELRAATSMGNGEPGDRDLGTGRERGSMSAADRRELGPVAQASRALVAEGRDRQCGCNSRDPGNGHAGRAGF